MADRSELENLKKQQLQDRLQDAGEPISGSKADLVDRLLAVESSNGDAEDTPSNGATSSDPASSADEDRRAGGGYAEHLAAVRATVRSLTSFDVESFVEIQRADDGDGWSFSVQVVESRRVPAAADVVSIFRVDVAGDGSLRALERIERGRRDRIGLS